MSTPTFSVGLCPVCGGGRCGIRIYHAGTARAYGLVICDECEALWTEPDRMAEPIYAQSEQPCSPIDGWPLWDDRSDWADLAQVAQLGWLPAIDPTLVYHGPRPVDDDPLALSAPAGQAVPPTPPGVSGGAV